MDSSRVEYEHACPGSAGGITASRSALDDMLPRLCELMAEFMIAVPIESGDELLVPALLPATRPPELDEWTAGWSGVRLTAELYPQAPPGSPFGCAWTCFVGAAGRGTLWLGRSNRRRGLF